MASMASYRVSESARSNRIRHGANRKREHWFTHLQKPLGSSAATISLLEIPGHSHSQFNQWLEIEDGEAGVFVDAGRIANCGRQNDLSPYRIERASFKDDTCDDVAVCGYLLRIEAEASNRKIGGVRYLY